MLFVYLDVKIMDEERLIMVLKIIDGFMYYKFKVCVYFLEEFFVCILLVRVIIMNIFLYFLYYLDK